MPNPNIASTSVGVGSKVTIMASVVFPAPNTELSTDILNLESETLTDFILVSLPSTLLECFIKWVYSCELPMARGVNARTFGVKLAWPEIGWYLQVTSKEEPVPGEFLN